MNKQLEKIKDAWDKNTGDGRDESARTMADAYVAEHSSEFMELDRLSLEECVRALEVFRDAGMEESQWRVETWLLYRWPPQNIGGTVQLQARRPGLGG